MIPYRRRTERDSAKATARNPRYGFQNPDWERVLACLLSHCRLHPNSILHLCRNRSKKCVMAIELDRKLLKIRRERKRRGWTQVDLSFYAAVPVSEVSRCEMGYGTYPSYVEKLASALGLKPAELLEEADK